MSIPSGVRCRDLRLSIVIVCYNMAREIPRTLESLSPRLQKDVGADDYEIIVVDNGSSEPANPEVCLSFGANVRLLSTPVPNASPARAISWGVAHAKYPNLGILIDGARMASPGLLARAREVLAISGTSVVGTIGFHLGPKVQMESVAEGYNQEAEDRLLASVDWQSDAYRLFEISSFAGSSLNGWFSLPAETNAVFLSKDFFDMLGGYDERFVSPGGGLINHDFWNRVCACPDSRVVMLLGEGTFHQVHGGVATNAKVSPWESFTAEYAQIRGESYRQVMCSFKLYGSLGGAGLRKIL
ncbi:cephalosporin hydroxylase [Hyphomonas polymorpha PS728]|uniref:Cephalosporin hydroxylase n=1 Tax=Hyphomonas polymorpha PS728 TaxID=1280954 RepID=A0A062VLU4_9PROT|nr:glycosyltransferase [Hyphomonas polymorpha]KDA00632.1 cephalosporin hydroxylase [Hyphomonas polymorpha PS728]